jgi:hypothetical protein
MNLEERQQNDLVLYGPKSCAVYSYKIKTVKDVLTLPSKSLGDFKRDYGKDWVIGYLSMWLIELNDHSNVKNKMTDSQMEFTANRIYESYSLKVTDLTLFFRNIKEGVYGQYYESLSQEKIMSWLKEYYDLRCEYGEMIAQSRHDGFSLTKDPIAPDVVKEMFKDVGEEKVVFEKGEGMGQRKKNMLTAKLLATPTDELKQYLIDNDVNNPNYNEFIYTEVEQELDRRNKTK